MNIDGGDVLASRIVDDLVNYSLNQESCIDYVLVS